MIAQIHTLLRYALLVMLAGLLVSSVAAQNPKVAPQSDESMLKMLPDFSPEELESLFEIYYNLKNQKMVDAILKDATRRDPALAQKLRESIRETDPRADAIYRLTDKKRYAEAIRHMEQMKSKEYKGKRFPFDLPLAESYAAVKNTAKAKQGFRKVLSDPQSSATDLAAAKKGLQEVTIYEHLSKKRYREAISYLETLKAREYSGQRFPFELALGDSHTGAKNFSKARASYRRVLETPGFSAEDRQKAVQGLESVAIEDLLFRKQYDQAIVYMEDLENGKYAGRLFPHRLEMGDTFAGKLDFDIARMHYNKVLRANYSPEEQARARQGIHETNVAEAMQDTYDLMTLRKREEALAMAEENLTRYPNEPEIRMLHAQALSFNWRFEEALPILLDVKEKHFQNKPYPAQSSIGECNLALGKVPEAKNAYRETATMQKISADERVAAQRILNDNRKHFSSSANTGFEFITLSEGEGYTIREELSFLVDPLRRMGARAYYHDVSLSDERAIRADEGDMLGASAFVRQYLDGSRYVEGWVGGGSHDKFSGGVSLGRQAYHESNWSHQIYAKFNDPLLDSLQSVALDGLQNVVGVEFEGPLNYDLRISGGGKFRTASIDDIDLGDGFQFFAEATKAIWRDKRERSGVFVSIRGEYDRFESKTVSPRESAGLGFFNGQDLTTPGDSLIDPEYFPVGVFVSAEAELSSRATFFGRAGTVWDFADEEYIHEASAGIHWHFSQNSDFTLHLAYYSGGGGRGGIVSQDDAVFVGSVGYTRYF